MDGSAVCRAEVVVDAVPQMRRKSARKNAEIRSRVHEELAMSVEVGDKEAARGGRANVGRRIRSPS
jgi:hypothetical protein